MGSALWVALSTLYSLDLLISSEKGVLTFTKKRASCSRVRHRGRKTQGRNIRDLPNAHDSRYNKQSNNKVSMFWICCLWYLSSSWIIICCIVGPELHWWISMLCRFYAWPNVQEFGLCSHLSLAHTFTHAYQQGKTFSNIVMLLSIYLAYSVTFILNWCLFGLHEEV